MAEATLDRDEGLRCLVMGNSRRGKSTGINCALRTWQPKVDAILIHDAKYRVPQYAHDAVIAHVGDFQPEHGGKIVEVHSQPHVCDVDAVATFALDASLQRMRTMVVVDEWVRALDGRAFIGGSTSPIARVLSEGGGLGISLLGTIQIPQDAPPKLLQLCDWQMIFQMESTSVRYVQRDLSLSDAAVTAIETLQPGQFVLNERGGGGWDGKVYVVPAEFVVKRA